MPCSREILGLLFLSFSSDQASRTLNTYATAICTFALNDLPFVIMASISSTHVPMEVLTNIVSFALCDENVTGRGIQAIGKLSLVSKAWREAALYQRARLPRKRDEREGEPGNDNGKEEVHLRGAPLQVKDVLFWCDLETASRCIDATRNKLELWAGIRAIFVSFKKRSGEQHIAGDLRLGHVVFRELYHLLWALRDAGLRPALQWVRIDLRVWQGLDSIDAPGMFYLSRLRGIPFVRFTCKVGSSISSYVSKDVRNHVYS